jgi:hypothetical protein
MNKAGGTRTSLKSLPRKEPAMSEHLDQPWPGGVPESTASDGMQPPPAPETATPRNEEKVIRYFAACSPDTPRTNETYLKAWRSGDKELIARAEPWDFARTLERDLAAAQASLSDERTAWDAMNSFAESLKSEVAGLRAAIFIVKTQLLRIADDFMPANDQDQGLALGEMREAVSALAESLRATGAAGGWRPIETAPKSAKAIMVHCSERQNTYVVYHNGKWHHFGGFSELTETPTHWQPLPTPPNPQPTEG